MTIRHWYYFLKFIQLEINAAVHIGMSTVIGAAVFSAMVILSFAVMKYLENIEELFEGKVVFKEVYANTAYVIM